MVIRPLFVVIVAEPYQEPHARAYKPPHASHGRAHRRTSLCALLSHEGSLALRFSHIMLS